MCGGRFPVPTTSGRSETPSDFPTVFPVPRTHPLSRDCSNSQQKFLRMSTVKLAKPMYSLSEVSWHPFLRGTANIARTHIIPWRSYLVRTARLEQVSLVRRGVPGLGSDTIACQVNDVEISGPSAIC